MAIVEALVLLYFVYVVCYTFVFSLAGFFYRNPSPASKGNKKFAVFIPAYKEDSVIVGVAQKALAQSYPNEFYDVIIIADLLQPETVAKLKQLHLQSLKSFRAHFDGTRNVQFYVWHRGIDQGAEVFTRRTARQAGLRSS